MRGEWVYAFGCVSVRLRLRLRLVVIDFSKRVGVRIQPIFWSLRRAKKAAIGLVVNEL